MGRPNLLTSDVIYHLARTVICDGVDEVRKAAREEIRRGASHLKLMLSGGVASPTDRIDSTQFSREEIRAAVEEAEAANLYVVGHAYTSRAINRGLECGVRSIEHGNLMDVSLGCRKPVIAKCSRSWMRACMPLS